MSESVAKAEDDAPGSTKSRILHTAARLFAERGFENVSMRDLTREAGTNIAAVNYHFGTKVGLLARVFERYSAPVNRKRMELLERCAAQEDRDEEDITALLEAFLSPPFLAPDTVPEGVYLRKMMGQMSASPNPDVRRILFSTFDHVAKPFAALLERACPDLSHDEFYWRLTCVYGAMMYAQADNGRIRTLAGDSFESGNMENALKFMIPFLTAGMTRAPVRD